MLQLNSECAKWDRRLYCVNGGWRTRAALQSKSSPVGSCSGNSRCSLSGSKDPNSFCAPSSLLLWSLLYFGRCASLSGVAPANSPSHEETSCKAVEDGWGLHLILKGWISFVNELKKAYLCTNRGFDLETSAEIVHHFFKVLVAVLKTMAENKGADDVGDDVVEHELWSEGLSYARKVNKWFNLHTGRPLSPQMCRFTITAHLQIHWIVLHSAWIPPVWQVQATLSQIQSIWGLKLQTASAASIRGHCWNLNLEGNTRAAFKRSFTFQFSTFRPRATTGMTPLQVTSVSQNTQSHLEAVNLFKQSIAHVFLDCGRKLLTVENTFYHGKTITAFICMYSVKEKKIVLVLQRNCDSHQVLVLVCYTLT